MNLPALSAIKARLSAATPGPWVNRPGGVVQSQTVSRIIFWDDEPNQGDTHERIKPDYDFIAHAPTDLLRLISALELAIERHELSLELSEHAARLHFEATLKDIARVLAGGE